MGRQDGNRRRLKTADNLLDIVAFIDEQGGAGVSEISEEIGLAKSTVHEYLYTLTDREYLVNQGGVYDLGLRFYDHGISAKDRHDFLPTAEPFLEKLADETGGGVAVIVEEHGKAIILETEMGEHSVETPANKRIGHRQHLHCHAAGKVILAHMPEEQVYEIIERHGLPERTANTITDSEELFEELAEVREQGYAINNEETDRKVKAIAAPILSQDDTIIGALAIDGPAGWMDRMDFESTFPDHLTSAVDEIMLRYDWENKSR